MNVVEPHISNGPVNDKIFMCRRWRGELLQLPCRWRRAAARWCALTPKAIAEHSRSPEDFSPVPFPTHCQQQIAIINARCDFLYEQAGFLLSNSFPGEKRG